MVHLQHLRNATDPVVVLVAHYPIHTDRRITHVRVALNGAALQQRINETKSLETMVRRIEEGVVNRDIQFSQDPAPPEVSFKLG